MLARRFGFAGAPRANRRGTHRQYGRAAFDRTPPRSSQGTFKIGHQAREPWPALRQTPAGRALIVRMITMPAKRASTRAGALTGGRAARAHVAVSHKTGRTA